MLSRKQSTDRDQAGFSLVELLVVMSVVGILFTTFSTFFGNYLTLYSGYQRDASNFSELAQQSQRISDVLRGIVDIISAENGELKAYAYFSPADAYTSVVYYYLSPDKKSVIVDVTPMTANPPYGTLIASKKRTYTIVTNYAAQSGVNLFTYYDSGGDAVVPPVANQHVITSIKVNLSEKVSQSQNGQQLAVTVSLRNRKINL